MSGFSKDSVPVEVVNELESERDALRVELSIYSEILANVLHTTGPVVVTKENRAPKGAVIDTDFASDGSAVVISLKVDNAGK